MWLHIPTISCQSAQEQEASTSLSKFQSRMLALFATSKGKSKPPQFWQRAFKTKPCMKRLSGLTCPVSTANRSVDLWIASLAATRVSQTVLPDHVLEPKTTVSSSTNLFGSQTKCGLAVSSARTSQGMRTDSLKPLSLHWKQWATALRQEYSAREKWGQATDVKDCSSWQTPKVSTGGWEKQKDGSKKLTLQGESETWPTPCAQNHKGSGKDCIIRKDGKSRLDQLHYMAEQAFHTLHQDQTTQYGQTLSDKPPRLNPLFVEWLMGLPIGQTNYEQPVTGFAQWLEQSRGYLFQLILRGDLDI